MDPTPPSRPSCPVLWLQGADPCPRTNPEFDVTLSSLGRREGKSCVPRGCQRAWIFWRGLLPHVLAQELHQFHPALATGLMGKLSGLQGSSLECISSWERRKPARIEQREGTEPSSQLCPPSSGWEEGQPASAGGLWGQSVLELEEGMGIIGMSPGAH